MTKLNSDDRKKLLHMLEDISILQTLRGRIRIMELAGLEKIAPLIDLEGSTFIVVGDIVSVLDSYGKVTFENDALGLFISTVKAFVGESSETYHFLEFLLSKYQLMIPEAKYNKTPEWGEEKSPEEALEKIIGENTLRHIFFIKRCLEVSKSVCFIEVDRWAGTGFLFTPNLLITCNHVIPELQYLEKAIFHFNYQLANEGVEESRSTLRAKQGGVFYTNKSLDYSIIELEKAPDFDIEVVRFSTEIVNIDSRVNIIQHPGGLPKQISFQNNFVEYVDSRVIQYVTSTLGGSSGSPVFNDSWDVVALHHAGGNIIEPQTGRKYFRNEGIAISAIWKDMPKNVKEIVNSSP